MYNTVHSSHVGGFALLKYTDSMLSGVALLKYKLNQYKCCYYQANTVGTNLECQICCIKVNDLHQACVT
jgi:hypothetical protein